MRLHVSGIDVRVFVYRPDRSHPTEGDRQYSDFIIRNEKAVDVNPRFKTMIFYQYQQYKSYEKI